MDGPNGFDHQLKVISIASSAHIPSTLTSLSIKNLKVIDNRIFPTNTLFVIVRVIKEQLSITTSLTPRSSRKKNEC